MKRHLGTFALLGLLVIGSFACLSSTNGSASGSPDAGALGADAGGACDSQVLVRCVYPNGTCAEFSGPPIGDAGDPFDCLGTGQGVLTAGEACSRTGTEGSCVDPSGITLFNGKDCQFFLTTWIPNGYDSGSPGQMCVKVGGTFEPDGG
jgi:hypothetical protein